MNWDIVIDIYTIDCCCSVTKSECHQLPRAKMNIWECGNMLCLIVLLVSEVNTFVKTYQIVDFKMVTITLYTRQQKRHRCIKQSFGHCGRRRGWDDLGEWHWNMYIISHMWNESPVQVWCMIQYAQGWCTGTTLWDGWGREVGGNTCTPMADSCQCMAKTIQYCKVISLQLK